MNLPKIRWAVPLICSACFLIALLSISRWFYVQESFFYDKAFGFKQSTTVTNDIVIIEIDDATLNQLGQWPLPRDYYGTLVQVLHELGARAIVFDLIFAEPSVNDGAFAQAMQKAGNVYLAQAFDIDVNGRDSLISNAASLITPIVSELTEATKALGHINTFIDPDGKVRQVPLFINRDGLLEPHMSLRVACDYLGIDCQQMVQEGDGWRIDERLHIPVSKGNHVLVNYLASWDKSFRRLSMLEILSTYQQYQISGIKPEQLALLQGKVCFIGLTATGTVDLRPTPVDKNYPMVGVLANVLDNILQERYMMLVPLIWQLIYVVLILLVSIWCSWRLTPLKSLLVNLGLIGCILGIFMLCFLKLGMWIDVFLPIVGVLLSYVVCTMIRWINEQRELQRLEQEMAIGQKIQMQFLPMNVNAMDTVDMAGWFSPAKYVAGDFYDVFQIDKDKVGILMGDVSGKGLPAALCMAQTISLFRIFAQGENNPAHVLGILNDELCKRQMERFATAIYGVLDIAAEVFTFAAAGGTEIWVYRANTQAIEVIKTPPSPPLSVMPQEVYNNKSFVVRGADKIFLFSDGVLEARSASKGEINILHLRQWLAQQSILHNSELLEQLKHYLKDYIDPGNQHDDITALIISLKG